MSHVLSFQMFTFHLKCLQACSLIYVLPVATLSFIKPPVLGKIPVKKLPDCAHKDLQAFLSIPCYLVPNVFPLPGFY